MPIAIFISHRHSDQGVAASLADFLLASLEVNDSDIRATSVAGHQLPFGSTIASQLKDDIHTSAAVIALITQDSLRSNWVVFELGASWALGKTTIPILAPGVAHADLPGPLSQYPCVEIDSDDAHSRLRDSITQMANTLGIAEKTGGRAQAKLDGFISTFREWIPGPATADLDQARAFETSWLIMTLITGEARHPTAVAEQIEVYLRDFSISLPDPVAVLIRSDDGGASVMQLLELIGGKLMAEKPILVPYFQAAPNILLDAARNEGRKIPEIVATISVPEELAQPRDDKVQWANAIHDHFATVLHERA